MTMKCKATMPSLLLYNMRLLVVARYLDGDNALSHTVVFCQMYTELHMWRPNPSQSAIYNGYLRL